MADCKKNILGQNPSLKNQVLAVFQNLYSAKTARILEKKILEDDIASREAELIAVYCRRRIGKTFLIRSVYEKYIKFESTNVQCHNAGTIGRI